MGAGHVENTDQLIIRVKDRRCRTGEAMVFLTEMLGAGDLDRLLFFERGADGVGARIGFPPACANEKVARHWCFVCPFVGEHLQDIALLVGENDHETGPFDDGVKIFHEGAGNGDQLFPLAQAPGKSLSLQVGMQATVEGINSTILTSLPGAGNDIPDVTMVVSACLDEGVPVLSERVVWSEIKGHLYMPEMFAAGVDPGATVSRPQHRANNRSTLQFLG
jgi:hypothetical protein